MKRAAWVAGRRASHDPCACLLHRRGYDGPHDCGTYNSAAWETGFFVSQGGSWDTPYGHFFLSWYSGALLRHADRVLAAAASALNKRGRPRKALAAKEVHCPFSSPSSPTALQPQGSATNEGAEGDPAVLPRQRERGACFCKQQRMHPPARMRLPAPHPRGASVLAACGCVALCEGGVLARLPDLSPGLSAALQHEDGHVVYEFEPACHLGAKLAGVHWWFKSRAHAAELTAGYYNTRERDGYAELMAVAKRSNVRLSFTCVEMRDCEHPPEGRCSPEGAKSNLPACVTLL